MGGDTGGRGTQKTKTTQHYLQAIAGRLGHTTDASWGTLVMPVAADRAWCWWYLVLEVVILGGW